MNGPPIHSRPTVLAIAAAFALFLLLFLRHECSGSTPAEAAGDAEKTEPTTEPPAAGAPQLPRVEISSLVDPEFRDGARTRVLRGRLFDDQGEPVRDQPYWVHWGHQHIDETRDLGEATTPLVGARRTDSLGRFAVDVRTPGHGLLWFHAPSGLRAACVINEQTLSSRTWHDVRLPKCDTVSIEGIGLDPSARFRVLVNPATKNRSGWDSSEVELWPARFWRRSNTEVDFLVTHSFQSPEFVGSGHVRVLAWRPFEFVVQGEDFEVQPQEDKYRVVRAPGKRVFRVGKKAPSGIVVVRDSASGPPTTLAGVAITGPLRSEGRWRERSNLENGHCGLGYQMLRAGETTRLWVVMADGEWFEREIRVDSTARQPTVTFVRGRGHPPVRVPTGLDEAWGRPRILAELDRSRLVRGQQWTDFRMPDRDHEFAYVLTRDAVLLVRCPESFTRLIVIGEDGRVAAGRDRASSFPGKLVNEVDLADAYQRFGKQGKACAEFDLEIVTPSGRKHWINVDRCWMGPRTRWFPVWHKFVPSGMRFRFALAVDGEEPVELVSGQ